MCILTEILLHAHVKEKNALMISNLVVLVVIFQVTARQVWQWKD